MIPRHAKDYCCEDISLIENYEQAVNDKIQIWDCHHRKETDEGLSKDELIKQGLYWNRPASELIFLTRAEHIRLHKKGSHLSAQTKANISSAKKDKKQSEEHKAKIGAANAKAVYQIHKATGIIIREWKCMNEAARILGIPQSSIVLCCQGKYKSAGGFIWRYA